MSWLTNILPKIKWSENKDNDKPTPSPVPEGVWLKCEGCDETLYAQELQANVYVCPKCGAHHRLHARERLLTFFDPQSTQEIGADVVANDPLSFKDSKSYRDRVNAMQKSTGEKDALVVMQGLLRDEPMVAAAFEFSFMGGSMGSVVGEKFAMGVDAAIEQKCPFVCFAASGGARMQEGLFSLMQMTKTSAQVARLRQAHLPFISVLTDPTMGGVSASFAFLGDVVLAEPNALIGFAGPRVIEQTVREKLPEGFQRSEFLLEKGQIDRIVDRRNLRHEISALTALLMKKQPQQS